MLRYDDRGVGKSSGNYSTTKLDDFASDALAALEPLRKDDKVASIGLIGHSEGGLIAQIIASRDSVPIDFVILMASPGVSIQEILIDQNINLSSKPPYNLSGKELHLYKEQLRKYYSNLSMNKSSDELRSYLEPCAEILFNNNEEQKRQFITRTMQAFESPYLKSLMQADPKNYLSKIKCRVMAINGAKDTQVNAEQNLRAIKTGLKKKVLNKSLIKTYSNLNHIFIPCKTGEIDEYYYIQEPIAAEVLQDIKVFIYKENL